MSTLARSNHGSDNLRHHEFLFGGLAYSASVITLFPFYKTIFFQQLNGVSWLQAFARLKHEGISLVYRGVLPPLLQRASSGAVMFGVQSLTERTLTQHPLTVHVPFGVNKFVSAVFAGFCEAPLMPFERVQTLLQNKHDFPSYRNTFHTLSSLTMTHGLKELYRGLTPVLIRNSCANALYFGGHKWLSDLRVRGTHEGPFERGLWNLALGGLLGGSIGLFTFPLNVIKTRMQSTVGGGFESFRSALFALVYHRDHKPDITRLYRGLPANIMRSFASWGIITMTYHFLLERYSGIAS
ncbi:Mitochondrial carrier triple repeat protein 1 [Paragonimus heterotremus]|uniref:Mitochondrial carrier triple repeat protein 1 n=1 Tax=Paragonimus heterotremus TaxID=100268 RepID=A0A8J4SYG9_9TREM|nr:Mitochondrial carrier triple repeat protein 1 [Paragonimus heterotremus]